MRALWSILVFIALSFSVSGPSHLAIAQEITVVIVSPDHELIPDPQRPVVVDEVVAVVASVTSTLEITHVTAQVATISNTLVFDVNRGFVGNLNLESLPSGPYTLTVTAHDVGGFESTASRLITLNRKPRITVTSPYPGMLGRPMVPLDITCVDPDSAQCAYITVAPRMNDTAVITSDGTPIRTTLSLASYEGEELRLSIAAGDGDWLILEEIPVYIESSPMLYAVLTVGTEVLAVDATRLVYTRTQDGISELVLQQRSEGSERILLREPGVVPKGAWLTSDAVLARVSDAHVFGDQLIEWRDTERTLLGPVGFADPLVVGDYAVWWTVVDFQRWLYQRDVRRGTTEIVTNNMREVSLSSDGTVVFTTPTFDLIRASAGMTTTVRMGSDSFHYLAPYVDGAMIVVTRLNTVTAMMDVLLLEGEEETVIAANVPAEFVGEQSIALRDGWVVFPRVGTGTSQLWRRGPDGREEQLTRFGTPSRQVVLGPQGAVMLTNNGARYGSRPNESLQRVGSGLGHPVWMNDQAYIMLGQTLLRVLEQHVYLPALGDSQ